MNHTSNFNLIGIDPGTNTGISVFEVNTQLELVNIKTFDINLNKYADENSNGLTKDVDRYLALFDLVTEVVTTYKPRAVAIESAFINNKFKGSGLKLAGYVSVVITAIKKQDKNIILCKLAPKSVKKFMGDATANKDKMLAMLGNELSNFIDVTTMSEHTIDATSIGSKLLDVIRDSPHILKGI